MSKLTVVIPTYNRAALLRESISSVLAQDYEDFQVIVLDNASTDETPAVIAAFHDPRLSCIRHSSNVGAFGNWNFAIEVNRSPFLSIFHDDDVMQPGFLRESMKALEQNSGAGFSFTLCQYVDAEGKPLRMQHCAGLQPGCVSGLHVLERMVASAGMVIHAVSVVMRASALKSVGLFDSPHSRTTFDVNLYLRLAAQHDVVFLSKPLVHLRIHAGQSSATDRRAPNSAVMFSSAAEYLDALAYLMRSPLAESPEYRAWIAERMLAINASRSESAHYLIPNLNWSWEERTEMIRRELDQMIPAGEPVIFLDQNQLDTSVLSNRCLLPFPERDGYYNGLPEDDAAALCELDRLCNAGATHLVIPWPGFNFLELYPRFAAAVERRYRCVLRNARLQVYALHQEARVARNTEIAVHA